jgi:cytochrome d ubiquinol oxidase subunit I
MNVLKFNPEKDAAYEGIFYSVNGAPLYSFGIPDEKNKTIHFAIGMPYGLSVLESGNPFSKVKGLCEYPTENWPPVNVIFTTFHLMVMLGMLMIAAGAIGVFLLWKKKLLSSKWYLLILPWLIPLPYCANELGWIGAEIGRQPWTIHGVMKTADAVSLGLVPWQVATSLFVIVFVYLLLIVTTLYFVIKQIKTGPTL